MLPSPARKLTAGLDRMEEGMQEEGTGAGRKKKEATDKAACGAEHHEQEHIVPGPSCGSLIGLLSLTMLPSALWFTQVSE